MSTATELRSRLRVMRSSSASQELGLIDDFNPEFLRLLEFASGILTRDDEVSLLGNGGADPSTQRLRERLRRGRASASTR